MEQRDDTAQGDAMSAKKDVQIRAAVVAAADQIDAQMSDLSRARARRAFAAMVNAEGTVVPSLLRQRAASKRAVWAVASSALAVAAAALLALKNIPRTASDEHTALAAERSSTVIPTPLQLTAERVDARTRRHVATGESMQAEHMSSTHIRFSDGTDVALVGGATLHVARMAPEGAEIHVEQGTVTAAVVHQNARTAWDFVAGPFRVHVVGTTFDLGWEPKAGRMQLAMHEGIVTVEGCGVAAREVRAPHDLELACAEKETNGEFGAAALAKTPPANRTPRGTPATRESDAPPTLDSLLNNGDWDAAYALVAPDFDTRILQATPEQSLRLGDIARMAKHGAEAERAYLAAAERGHLALAWLELAKLQLLRGHANAARASADAAARSGTGSLVEDAHMLGVEAALSARDEDDARRRSRAYLLEFPEGSHVQEVAKLTPPALHASDAGAH